VPFGLIRFGTSTSTSAFPPLHLVSSNFDFFHLQLPKYPPPPPPLLLLLPQIPTSIPP
jgi:hypothetical protein